MPTLEPTTVRLSRIASALVLTATVAFVGRAAETVPAESRVALDEPQTRKWTRFWEEQQAMALIVALSDEVRRQDATAELAVDGVTVIPMTGEGPLADRTVIVQNGRFREIGSRSELEARETARRIDAAGRFLIPGLTESHAHTIHSPSQLLVYLTQGVTTLREMDGYAWMLEARARATRGELLVPNLYVAGHILSNRPYDFYMTGVTTEDQARQLVRDQSAAGYDFVKIHNSLPEPLFGAVFAAAREEGLDVVGHIPNEIRIADAISAGLRTNEHFKGYLFDETLEITEQSYVDDTRGSELWNTPTFTSYHDHLRGAESRELVEREGSLPLVPRWLRESWRRQSDQEVDRLTALRQTVYPKSRKIFTDLWQVTDKFIAGTDTGSYAYMVPGFALQEEVRIFESLGLSPFEALETATVNAALALRQEAEFGTVEVGKRADFVLLEANPLEGGENLAGVVGVSLRGVWLDEGRLADIRSRLAEIFSADNAVPEASRHAFENLVQEAKQLLRDGWPYPEYILEEIREFLRELGHGDLASDLVSDLTAG